MITDAGKEKGMVICMKIVAGVDGGGTGTTLEIWDAAGQKRDRKTFGPFNINSIGEQNCKRLLSEIFEVIVQAGECRAVCILSLIHI